MTPSPTALLVDPNGLAYATPAAFFAALAPNLASVEVHGSLVNGGILASLTMGHRVVEFGPDGTPRWQITAADVDGAINDACGIQRLPGGTTMIASYRVGKDGVKLLEVTPDRKVAWTWKPAGPGIHHFHVFEIDGQPVPTPALR